MLSFFKSPLAAASRVRSPDLIDRTRIAAIAALAGFAALALALVSHFALAGDPLSLPGLQGHGQVLITPAQDSGQRANGGSQGITTTRPAPTISLAPVPAASAAGPGRQPGSQDQGASNLGNSGPRQVGISIGSGPAAQPAPAPVAPGGSGTAGSGGSGNSGTAGTGGGAQDPGSPATPTQPPSAANDWGHSPVGPPAGATSGSSGRTGGSAKTTSTAKSGSTTSSTSGSTSSSSSTASGTSGTGKTSSKGYLPAPPPAPSYAPGKGKWSAGHSG